MVFQKDEEILELKRKAGVDYRDLANVLGVSPNSVTRRVLGFQVMTANDRLTLIKFLQEKQEKKAAK